MPHAPALCLTLAVLAWLAAGRAAADEPASLPSQQQQQPQRCPAELRVGVLDYELAPLLLGKDKSSQPTGKLIDWIRQAVARSGCTPRLQLQRLPITRGRELLARNEIDVWGVAFPGAELLANSVLPMQQDGQVDAQLGFYLSSYSLYTDSLSPQQISWDGQTLRGPEGLRVGVAPVPALRAVLAERNWTPENGLDTQNVLNKLVQGRSAVAILPDMLMATQPAEVLARLRKLSPPVLTSWYYAPISKDFFARHPAFARSFWLEMCKAGRAEQRSRVGCRE